MGAGSFSDAVQSPVQSELWLSTELPEEEGQIT